MFFDRAQKPGTPERTSPNLEVPSVCCAAPLDRETCGNQRTFNAPQPRLHGLPVLRPLLVS